MQKTKQFISMLLNRFQWLRKIALFLFPKNISLQLKVMELNFLKEMIYNHYSEESINNKRFYNVGAGNQRSKYNIWTYLDLEHSEYNKDGVHIHYDLESLKPLPLSKNKAEVVLNSFVMEHISVKATKHFCKESLRVLKKGGVFHSKVHCYDYAVHLLKRNLISPKVPYECRESSAAVRQFLSKYKNKVKTFFNANNEYVIQSIHKPHDQLIFNAYNSFMYQYATAAMDAFQEKPEALEEKLNRLQNTGNRNLYHELKSIIQDHQTKPHQHNADYISKYELFWYLKSLGFSEVYFT